MSEKYAASEAARAASHISAAANPALNTAVGHAEVIKMHYQLGLTTMDEFGKGTPIATTDSHLWGVSLSELKWGFYNASESGAENTSYIEFTLHDIAGAGLNDYLKLKSGITIISFVGPDSGGNLWPGDLAFYKPIAKDCSMEFSATQGFTYKITAQATGRLTETKELTVHSKFSINGLCPSKGDGKHNNTFEEYLKEFEEKWKTTHDNPKKAPTAGIKFEINITKGINDDLKTKHPYLTVKRKEGVVLVREGDPTTTIQEWEVKQGAPIAHEIKRLWQERFVPNEISASSGTNAGSQIEVNWKNYKGGVHTIDVRLHRRDKTDTVVGPTPVCIGSDLVCAGHAFRAQLVGMDFGGLDGLMAIDKMVTNDESTEGDASNASNESNTVAPADPEWKQEGDRQIKETVTAMGHTPGWGAGKNPSFDGWGQMRTILNMAKSPEFKIDIELPYSFGFSPVVNGGFLEDAIDGNTTGAISFACGIELFFYWYTDTYCQNMAKVEEVSRKYRINKVTHTIGLNGNSTQIQLSHLTLTI